LVKEGENIAVLVLFLGIFAIKNDNYLFQTIAVQTWTSVLVISLLILNFRRLHTVQAWKEFLTKICKILGWLLLASIVDPLFYTEAANSTLIWPLRFVGRHLILFGDVIPGIFLTWQIFKKLIQHTTIRYVYPAIFTSYFSAMFGVYAYHLLRIYLKAYPNPEDHIMNHMPLMALFCQWNILIRVVYQMVMQRKAFSFEKQPASFRCIYLFVSLTPLLILIGNTATTMQILALLLIWGELNSENTQLLDTGRIKKLISESRSSGSVNIRTLLKTKKLSETESRFGLNQASNRF
jgi:hypothetical protein